MYLKLYLIGVDSNMIFGNAAWGFRETPLEEQFKVTSEMGLEVLEIGIANAPMDIQLHITEEEIQHIKRLAEKYKVRILCAATGNDFTTGTDDIEKLKKVIDICDKLGIPNLRIFTGFTPLKEISDERFIMMINALTVVCNYAQEKGVIPVIETHGGVNAYEDGVEHIVSTTTNLEMLKRIMALLPDYVGICFDPANLYAVGVEKPEVFYEAFKDKIVYAHFKDFKKLSSGHLLPSYCGDSDMNWNNILKSMADFKEAVLFEYENTEDVTEGLKKCYNYIKERV